MNIIIIYIDTITPLHSQVLSAGTTAVQAENLKRSKYADALSSYELSWVRSRKWSESLQSR